MIMTILVLPQWTVIGMNEGAEGSGRKTFKI
jgi:hypothetical protein